MAAATVSVAASAGSPLAAVPASVATPSGWLPAVAHVAVEVAPQALTFRSAVPAAARAAVARLGTWRWPVDGTPRPVRGFDPPPQPWLPGHRGVDLAAQPGDPVRAAGAGVVRYAGTLAGRGVVSVTHPDGLITTYEPVQPSVWAGEPVGPGAVLGTLSPGHPGCAAAACLHWGLRRGAAYLDPLAVLGVARVRLLPTR
ncbi:M23 family metallopeptidase [Catellatospora sp. KI3]|uniref:murein hydrolase activator EnvC family protein n=1 Tax=Catellatospora sp. KI3 TaxID=3041620 RepID=UPI0024825A4B|nr:M23 family metallopeptidase [Catellatospora sp. KI3]MDI1459469.1 M23 family metallopeptidase [Catellatospora sp. KI3]